MLYLQPSRKYYAPPRAQQALGEQPVYSTQPSSCHTGWKGATPHLGDGGPAAEALSCGEMLVPPNDSFGTAPAGDLKASWLLAALLKLDSSTTSPCRFNVTALASPPRDGSSGCVCAACRLCMYLQQQRTRQQIKQSPMSPPTTPSATILHITTHWCQHRGGPRRCTRWNWWK